MGYASLTLLKSPPPKTWTTHKFPSGAELRAWRHEPGRYSDWGVHLNGVPKYTIKCSGDRFQLHRVKGEPVFAKTYVMSSESWWVVWTEIIVRTRRALNRKPRKSKLG